MKKHVAVTILFIVCTFICRAQTQLPVGGTEVEADKTFTLVEKEAEFPGGLAGWRNFLITNLNTEIASDVAPRKAKHWKQTVIVKFIVDTNGTVSNVMVVNDAHPDLKKEAIRVISISSGWIPAEQNGRKVKAYRMQPITFIVE
jgi:periplasmic protein TonB